MTLLRPDSDKSEHRDYEGQAKVAVAYSADPSFAIALLRRAGAATKVRLATAKRAGQGEKPPGRGPRG